MTPVVHGRAIPVSLSKATASFALQGVARPCLLTGGGVLAFQLRGHSTRSPSSSAPSSSTLMNTINAPARRTIHSSERRTSTIAEPLILQDTAPGLAEPNVAHRAPLSVLPLSMIVRSLATTTVSASPVLLGPSLKIMGMLAHTTNPLMSPDHNPILRFFLKNTFYAQFCAGENSPEVQHTISRLKNIGFTGVILGYAKEVVLTDKQADELASGKAGEETPELIQAEVVPWAEGTLETVRLADPGDFVALK